MSQLRRGIPAGQAPCSSGQGREKLHEKLGHHLSFRTTVHVRSAALCDAPKLDRVCGPCHSKMTRRQKENIMTNNGKTKEPFTIGFIDEGSKILLEVMNKSDQALTSVEILTVFLKDEETPGGGPSRAHISFEALISIQANGKSIMSHKTWVDGKPAALPQDQLARLKVMAGKVRPYVLDFS